MYKTFVIDIDDTLSKTEVNSEGLGDYENSKPIQRVIEKINHLYFEGNMIILFTARGMKTFNGNVQEIENHHRPILTKWLSQNHVFYHQLIFGKPWYKDYYFIDDRSITINQFLSFDVNDFDKVIRHNNPSLYE